MSSTLEENAYLIFEDYVVRWPMRAVYGSTAYLALIEAEERQISYPVAVALGDRVPTGPRFRSMLIHEWSIIKLSS